MNHSPTEGAQGSANSKMPEARFMAKVIPEPNSGCWLWTGALAGGGYGGFYLNGRNEVAHRASYMIFRGPIPKGLLACHKCDTHLCVNPDHLFLGTSSDNSMDMIRKGRTPKVRNCLTGAKHHRSTKKLTDETVLSIYARRNQTLTKREALELFGVHPTTCRRIFRGLAWNHLTGAPKPLLSSSKTN